MDGRALQAHAAAWANELPGSELCHPFGDEHDVWKVRGKVFMLQTERHGQSLVTLKSAPDDSRALRESHPDITVGYHMNKRHWISLHGGGPLDPAVVEDLVSESYLLVVEGLPRAQRPVDPETFGRMP